MYIYTDGSLQRRNGKIFCGYGIYFGDNALISEFGGSILPQKSVVDGLQILTWSVGNNITNLQAKLFGVKQ